MAPRCIISPPQQFPAAVVGPAPEDLTHRLVGVVYGLARACPGLTKENLERRFHLEVNDSGALAEAGLESFDALLLLCVALDKRRGGYHLAGVDESSDDTDYDSDYFTL